MRGSLRVAPLFCSCLLLAGVARADADDDDARPRAPAAASALALSASQQEAVGLTLSHPVEAAGPRPIDAYGVVLDPVALVTDIGRLASSRAGARNAAADARRVAGLYHNDTNASLKALQTAEAAQIETKAQAEAAATTFALQWGPVAALPEKERDALVAALGSGQTLLVRADVPGQHVLGAMPAKALLTVDGIGIAARLLGPLPRTTPDLQSAGWLLEVDHAPPGLGPGAHLRITLEGAAVSGVLVPAAALLYGDAGAYVYRQAQAKTPDGKVQYAPASVKLLAPEGDGWLVDGLATADTIVVHGAGVLWSLQGLGSFSAAEEEHD
ncbi:MAG TPA: hypothetical protein VK820_05155 [Steroidobacteraceae bacterium]|jgi:hypothetical protein|nr:hypothetical protein [Steroidobacteraceae bacterium]